MTTDQFVIETSSLTKRYGDITAVDDLSMQVPRGHVFGLLGPNGSGKTTTMGMLLGLVKPTSGTFSVFGSSTRHQDALHRVGAIIESPSFYPYLSGRENLAYFQGISGSSNNHELDELLETVGLADRSHDKFHTYSLGMKQRLGLAYSLIGDPELLFLDEPTNGMDPAGMSEVRQLIRSLGTGGRTVLLSSHLLHEVEMVCDSVAILSHGKLIDQGNVAEMLRQTSDQIRMNTTDNEEAVRIIAALEWVDEVAPSDGALIVTAPADRSGEISAELGRHEVYVTEATHLRASLEEYFLEVTGGDNGETR